MKSLKYKLSVITLFQFIKVFEAYFYFSPKYFFRLIVLLPPAVLKQLFPKFTHALIANAFLTFGKSGRGIEMCLIASRFPPSTRYATSMLLDAHNNLNKVEEVWNLIRLYLSPEYIPLPENDPRQRKPDLNLAKELISWRPKTPHLEGLQRTIKYFQSKI
jgi:hypothetical protein